MGQYYKPVNLKNKQWVYSHDIKEKCTGHDGKTYMMGSGLKLMEHSWMKNSFVKSIESLLIPGGAWHKQPIVWAGDYAPEEQNLTLNIFSMCEEENADKKIKPKPLKGKYNFIVNHTKKEYVDKRKVPDKDGWQIHPLPLLTCEGNGQGGGDFRGDSKLVGKWARDIISVEKDIKVIGKGFIAIDRELLEGYK